MKIEILEEAEQDLIEGFRFYEGRETDVGSHFLDCLISDIDSLLLLQEYAPSRLRIPSYHLRVDEIESFTRIGRIRRVLAIVPKSEASKWLVQFGNLA